MPASLHLSVDEQTEQVMAWYSPVEGEAPPDAEALAAALAAQGLAEARIDPAARDAFLSGCQEGAAEQAPIGMCRPGRLEITVAANHQSAWLSLEPPDGGKPVDEAQLRAALAGQGIVYGLLEAEMREALASGRCRQLLIAQGRAPEAGEPARFESLLRHAGTSDERSPIDFRELGSLVVVDPGTPLMRRIPPRRGRDGTDILGVAIPAPAVPDLPFDIGPGTARSPQDPELLIATQSGLPSLAPRGVSVNPKVEVQDVDLASGNIQFDGTVHVRGDVRAGMLIKVTGDVLIDGTLEAAEVEAGGHVMVQGGIIGRAERSEAGLQTARVRAKGHVQARFIEHAQIEAGGSVQAATGLRDAEVHAGDEVLVGAGLVGGHIAALRRVHAVVLGAPWGDQTQVQVGVDPFLNAQIKELAHERQRRGDEQHKLQQVMNHLSQPETRPDPALRDRVQVSLQACEAAIGGLDTQIADLQARLEVSEQAVIEVESRIHNGVTLVVGPSVLAILEDRRGGSLRRVEGELSWK